MHCSPWNRRVGHDLATEQYNFQGIVKLSYSSNSSLRKVRVSSLTIWQGHLQLWYLCCFLGELYMGPDSWFCLLISEVYFQMLHFSPFSLPPLPGQVYTQSFKYFRRKQRLFWWPWVGEDFFTKALKVHMERQKDRKICLNCKKDLLFTQRLQVNKKSSLKWGEVFAAWNQ